MDFCNSIVGGIQKLDEEKMAESEAGQLSWF